MKIEIKNNKIYYDGNGAYYINPDGGFGPHYGDLNSLFKQVYSQKISSLIPDSTTLLKRITKK